MLFKFAEHIFLLGSVFGKVWLIPSSKPQWKVLPLVTPFFASTVVAADR